MLTIEEIRQRLKLSQPSKVAEATGLSKFTIMKIRDGATKEPAYSTIRRLSNALEGKPIEE